MLLVLALAALLWGLGMLTGIPRRQRGLLVCILFAAVLLAHLVLPDGHPLREATGGSAALWLILAGICYFIFASLNETYTWNWEGIWRRRWQIFGGWVRTIGISLASLALCIVVGLSHITMSSFCYWCL